MVLETNGPDKQERGVAHQPPKTPFVPRKPTPTPISAPIPNPPKPLSATPSLDEILEHLIAWSSETFGLEALVAARENFHLRAGKVFHEDAFFGARVSYFFDHYVFERPALGSTAATPFQIFLAQRGDALPEAVHRLAGFRHSVFQIKKVDAKQMVVVDLVTGQKSTVGAKGGENFIGLEKSNIFQGFLFPIGGLQQLSGGLVLHPQKVDDLLKKQLKLAKKTGEEEMGSVFFRLLTLQLRHLRMKHVDPRTFYKPTKK